MASQTAQQFYDERQARRRTATRSTYAGAYAPRTSISGTTRTPLYTSRYAAQSASAAALPNAQAHALPGLRIPTAAEVRAVILVVLVLTGIAFAALALSAAAAAQQQGINRITANIAKTEEDITDLKFEMGKASALAQIRERAENELDMKEPTYDQRIYLADLAAPEQGFAELIKEKAYGGGEQAQTEE